MFFAAKQDSIHHVLRGTEVVAIESSSQAVAHRHQAHSGQGLEIENLTLHCQDDVITPTPSRVYRVPPHPLKSETLPVSPTGWVRSTPHPHRQPPAPATFSLVRPPPTPPDSAELNVHVH